MQCSDVRKFIYVYLDEEFDRAESRELEAHLLECPSCRDMCRFEERFRVRLRHQLSVQRAPDALRSRVLSCIANPQPVAEIAERAPHEPALPVAGYRWVPMALAASVAAVVLWPFPLQTERTSIRTAGVLGIGAAPEASEDEAKPPKAADPVAGIEHTVVEEAVETHEDDPPLDLIGDTPTINRYLTSRTRVAMVPPLPETPETRLVGVRVLRTGLRPTAMYTYDHLGRRMTVVQRLIERQSLPVERPMPSLVALRRAGHLNVAVLRSDASVAAVVSDMPKHDLENLIPSNYTAAWAPYGR